MNFKDLLFPLAMALLGTWALQRWFAAPEQAKEEEVVADRSFVAPTRIQVAEPLDFTIDFFDREQKRPKEITEILLPYGALYCSNEGAALTSMSYRRELAGKETLIETLMPPQGTDEKGAFFVALEGIGATPLYYTLTAKEEGKIPSEGAAPQRTYTRLVYEGASSHARVIKEFLFYHNDFTIDLRLTLQPKTDQGARARIFLPAPVTNAIVAQGTVKAVMSSSAALEKKPLTDLVRFGKERPSLFGLEDLYFVNLLYKDQEKFAQRGYYKVEGENAQAILQSRTVKENSTWTLSFYCGPKELKSLALVDPRLEGLLEYGWFAPLSKQLLRLLNFLYGIVKSYGLAIILITILTRLILLPFTLGSDGKRRKTLEAQKKLAYLEQKYKHDPEMLARERSEYARKYVVPGMLSMVPYILQIPLFIALQRVLSHAIELYKAPFLWIPDLSAPDPYYILPLLIAVSMIFQLTGVGDPRKQVANILIALIIGAFTAQFSAGLALFIVVSTLLGIAQMAFQKGFNL